MRCLAIAQTCIEYGQQVCFLIADDNPVSTLEEAGVPYVILNSDWQDLMSDADRVETLLKKETGPVLLIDTYSITKEYVERLKPFCRIAYLGSKPDYLGRLDLLVNYSTYIDHTFYKENYNDGTCLMLGPAFAPLRKEFRGAEREYKNKISRILLTTGGTDRDHIVESILENLDTLGGGVTIDVVVGRMFTSTERLHARYDMSERVTLHENVKSMSSLMKTCDIAVSANGTTVYELAAMGVPIISFAMVEEQVKSGEALQRMGVIDYCGRSYADRTACVSRIKERLKYYMSNNDELISLAQKAHGLIDGNGCVKIAKALIGKGE